MSLFELIYRHLPGRTEEDYEESRSGKAVERRTGHPAITALTAWHILFDARLYICTSLNTWVLVTEKYGN